MSNRVTFGLVWNPGILGLDKNRQNPKKKITIFSLTISIELKPSDRNNHHQSPFPSPGAHGSGLQLSVLLQQASWRTQSFYLGGFYQTATRFLSEMLGLKRLIYIYTSLIFLLEFSKKTRFSTLRQEQHRWRKQWSCIVSWPERIHVQSHNMKRLERQAFKMPRNYVPIQNLKSEPLPSQDSPPQPFHSCDSAPNSCQSQEAWDWLRWTTGIRENKT